MSNMTSGSQRAILEPDLVAISLAIWREWLERARQMS